MDQEMFDWKSGRIVFWDLDGINEVAPLSEQVDDLKEDLAQIAFPGGTILDLGWYPSFDPQGEFKVTVVQNGDWERPVLQVGAKDLRSLKRQILLAISSSV
ncbi:hypothetical protein [Paludisphaera rhizosphaerae]|uniref:hypothetical protein n=1 Tax=Paludisphaera rhizosphaerae TaxID=2711216 RepID=UPI001F116A28|nr:hypothetical protein [Paludisphaera rhizosphaerae]